MQTIQQAAQERLPERAPLDKSCVASTLLCQFARPCQFKALLVKHAQAFLLQSWHGNPYPSFLGDQNPNGQIAIARHNQRIFNRVISGKFHKISHDERVNTFLLPVAIYGSCAKLNIINVCYFFMF